MRYLEDLPVGMTVDLGAVTVDEDEMLSFAARFDPQGFHTDAVAAAESPFAGVIASGWFTGSLFMRMYVDGFLVDVANLGGQGINVQFSHPVRAGDVLRAQVSVIESRLSRRRPDRGTLGVRGVMCNQDGVPVVTLEIRARVRRRVQHG